MTSFRVRASLLALAAALAASALGVARGQTATPAAPSPTRGVVLIDTNLALENAAAAGTGIVLTKTGEVLTNNHVIRGATTIKVRVPSTKRTYVATVLGYDIADDVALLKLKGATNLATVTRGNSALLKVGQKTRAVGNARGGGKLIVAAGAVTGLNRSISVRDDSGDVARLTGLIETSSRLVPGDSGGPLLDARGRAIGVDAAGSPSFGFNSSGPGYAIPINRALSIAKQVEAKRSSASVHIGATAFIGLSLAQDAEGVAVASVVSGSPAAAAGIRPGDVIGAIDGSSVASFADLRTLLFSKHPGDSVTLSWTDGAGSPASAPIVLASGPPQ